MPVSKCQHDAQLWLQAVRIEHMAAPELSTVIKKRAALFDEALLALEHLAGGSPQLVNDHRHRRKRCDLLPEWMFTDSATSHITGSDEYWS